MIGSLVRDETLSYPDADEFYSPSEAYPEYPFRAIARRPNTVYAAVRAAFADAQLDSANFGTAAWNPLAELIPRGSKIFVLCNFVYHRRPHETPAAFSAKCTHGSVLRAVLDYVFLAAGPGGTIQFGNAPLQSCAWNQVLADTGAAAVLDFYEQQKVRVAARDLRLFVAPRSMLGQATDAHVVDSPDGVSVALDAQSLLDDLYRADADVKLRVSDYNPDRLDSFHGVGKHRYIINREILTSDIVLSVPKLKTHEKVGITVGLKGLVGCVGHKDCLAHHRFGSPAQQGDEYPDEWAPQLLLSRFHDFVYRRRYPRVLSSILQVIDTNSRRVLRKIFHRIQAGAWHGNDTAWRMTVDLAHIMHYANARGEMCDTPQRRHLVIVDGVVGGEGNGPLSPTPIASQGLIFADNLVRGDMMAARIMGYDPQRIRTIAFAMDDPRLRDWSGGDVLRCSVNGTSRLVAQLPAFAGRPFAPPEGWKGWLP